MTAPRIDRFKDPLYTPAEAARYLGVSSETMRRWARGTSIRRAERADILSDPVITAHRSAPGQAAIPFVGLAEAYALRALRQAGVSLQVIRPALAALQAELGLGHALASKRLYTDGAEVLYDLAAHTSDDNAAMATKELVEVRHGQRVFTAAVEEWLSQVTYANGYAQVLPLPGYAAAGVLVDAARSFGQPIFSRGGARVQDALPCSMPARLSRSSPRSTACPRTSSRRRSGSPCGASRSCPWRPWTRSSSWTGRWAVCWSPASARSRLVPRHHGGALRHTCR